MKRATWLAIFSLFGLAPTSFSAEQKPVDALEKSLFNSEPVEEDHSLPIPSVSNAPVPPAPPPLPQESKPEEEKQAIYNVAVLQGLNKVTARISTIQAPVGEEVRFENLTIKIYTCWKSKPEDRPENAALIQINDSKTQSGTHAFSGWMYSSSPGLSGLEHPVYDVSLLDCAVKKEEKPKEEKAAKPASGNLPPPPR